jgi:hypothetical protein
MDSKEFKKIFGEVAKKNNFEKMYNGWLLESSECIVVLDLQKSNFGDYYELNVKIYIQGIFGNHYTKNKNLVKKDTGDIFTRQPNNYRDVLDFDVSMDDRERNDKLETLFTEFIIPLTNKALSKEGIKELIEQEKIFILPSVKKELM